jgi:hypothetical protein
MDKRICAAALIVAAAGVLEAHAATGGRAALVCGGVGNDERRELALAAEGANLALEFFLAGRGNYIADVDVTLTPAASPSAAFTLKTDGPICYLSLPPGRYRVDAAYNGAKKSATANVSAKGAKPTRIAMAFPAGAADIDPAPVSPEEKLQASKP